MSPLSPLTQWEESPVQTVLIRRIKTTWTSVGEIDRKDQDLTLITHNLKMHVPVTDKDTDALLHTLFVVQNEK